MNIDFNKIKPFTFGTIILMLIALICPGIMFIFVYYKDLFLQTDILRILLLATGITTPVWFINSIYVVLFGNKLKNREDTFIGVALIGSLFTIPFLYIPIIISFLFKTSARTGVLTVLGLEVILFLILFIDFKLKGKAFYKK